MLHPSTPTRAGKADDGIEQLKQSLSAKWGIQFPTRDPAWSPSRRDPNRREDRISAVIQYLYFRDGALGYAIEQFEKNARAVYSQWQIKPRAEPDLLPSMESMGHGVTQDFLHRRRAFEGDALRDITESLWWNLSQIADRVKAGEKFPAPIVPSIEIPKTASVESTRKMMDRTPQQSHLTQWFRLKSDPNPASSLEHPSSDEFRDEIMTDAFDEVEKNMNVVANLLIDPALRTALSSNTRRASNQTSSTNSRFETPPTSPSPLRGGNVGLVIGVVDDPRDLEPRNSESLSGTNRKRSFPGSMKPPMPRKSSRETRAQRAVHNDDYTAHKIDAKLQAPHSTLPKLDPFQPTKLANAVPTPPPDHQSIFKYPYTRKKSAENLTSVSSSMTSASSALTTPNTSFSADSMATSFSASAGGDVSDTTMRPVFDRSSTSFSASKRPVRSEADSDEWDQFYQAQDVKRPQVTSFECLPRTDEGISISNVMYDNVAAPSGAKISANGIAMVAPFVPLQQPPAPLSLEGRAIERLHSQSPFVSIPHEYNHIPLRQLYEVIRLSQSCKLPLTSFAASLRQCQPDYEKLWSSLASVVRANGTPLLERSSLVAWQKADEKFERVSLSGKLKFSDATSGPVFDLALSPLKMESSYRLARKFGHDRFFVVGIPSIEPNDLPPCLKPNKPTAIAIRDAIIKWLVECPHSFLGRTWRAFYVKPESGKKSQKGVKNKADDIRFRVYLFAEDGTGFVREAIRGELDPRACSHLPMRVKNMVEWFMPSRNNQSQLALKFFSRLALGLTSTTPTVEFLPREIIRSDDARAENPCKRCIDIRRSEEKATNRNPPRSTAPVMNDGCARISRDAANAVAAMLGMDYTPSVFQGRIGGAKGVWMVDALNEEPSRSARKDGQFYWIEITDSQLKFDPHSLDCLSPDSARFTFEVNTYSKKLTAGSLSFQLMPILENGGVPQDVFKSLLREDLTSRVAELEVAMDDPLSLRKWNQDVSPVAGQRATYGGIEMQGGLPKSREEQINWFVECGFEPKKCLFFKDQLYKAVHSYCLSLENRMNIGLGQSTNALIIADPLAILEEDEVHISFSSVFRDPKSGFDSTILHDMDVLVARLPAHLPSDIQKVRAVFKPELRAYRDVAIFSSKGQTPLAGKLSGGDYDGDKVWLCWDPIIVKPFHNAPVPDAPPPESYGIEKDDLTVSALLPHDDYMNRFLGHGLDFNLQMNLLGICSNYHESLCYHTNTIKSDNSIHVAALLGHLVDSNKQGYRFDEAKWKGYLKKRKMKIKHDPPAHKNKERARPKPGNLIDELVFNVAKKERQDALQKFTRHFQNVESWDEDLVRIRHEESEDAKSDSVLAVVLTNLRTGLEQIHNYWLLHCRRDDDEDDFATTAKRPNGISFRALVEKCHADFVALAPMILTPKTSNSTAQSIMEPTDTIRRWQRSHARNQPSHWDLVKASVAFYHYHNRTFVWHVAGVELGQIKAMARGGGSYHTVVNNIFDCYKLDGKLVNGAKRREMQLEADRAQRLEKGAAEEDDESDGDTQYGSAWSQVDPGEWECV